MKLNLFTIFCLLLVVIQGISDVDGESCLPPSRSNWVNVDLSDPKVQDIAKFAVETFPYLGRLISVDCFGELKVGFGIDSGDSVKKILHTIISLLLLFFFLFFFSVFFFNLLLPRIRRILLKIVFRYQARWIP